MWYMPTVTRESFQAWQTILNDSNERSLPRAAFSNRKRPVIPAIDPASGFATPPQAKQDDQMGKNPPPNLQDLHHSADNHFPSSHDLILQYPSGGTENFAFGKRIQNRTHRYARILSPIEDLIRTIEVLCIQNGSNTKAELQIMRTIIQTAYTNREKLQAVGLPSLQDLISKNIHYPKSHLHSPFTPSLIEHFFDQLHDRCIADIANLLERPGTASRENTYGEINPSFISTLCLQTCLQKGQTFLDLGSGVGQVAMQTSLETECTSFGIEREGRCHAVAVTHLQQFWGRVKLWGLERHCGNVHLRKGDFLVSGFVEGLIGRADVLLVNNLKLEPETDLELQGVLARGLKKGAKVISTRPLTPIGRKRRGGGEREVVEKKKKVKVGKGRARKVVVLPTPMLTPPSTPSPEPVCEDNESLVERSGEDDVWKWSQYVYAAGSVSWSDKRGLYYISERK